MILAMPVRELPRTYFPFALLTMFGPLLGMVAAGDSVHPSVAGLAFVALLLWGLARASGIAWLLLLLWNAFVVVSVVGVSGSTVSLGGVLLLLTAVPSVLLLLSPSMRAHLGVWQGRRAAAR
jgi:hypothetical protein